MKLCPISQNNILHMKFLELLYLCFHNSCKIWCSFSRTPKRNFLWCYYASVNSSCAQPPRVGQLQILHCPGAGHLPTPGPFLSFWHARGFLSESNYTEDFTGKKQIGSSVKDRKKLIRVVKACSQVFAPISSLLIKAELQSQIRSYRCESTFIGYWIKFRLILFEEHSFIFIKLFITYNFTALY